MDWERRLKELMLLLLALLGPVFHLLGIMRHGSALLSLEYGRLTVIYGTLALSGALAAYLLVRHSQLMIRLAAGAILIVNLTSIAYIASIWSQDMHHSFREAERVPFERAQVGILLSAPDDSAQEIEQLEALQEKLEKLIDQANLSDRILVRSGYSVDSQLQAQRMAEAMNADLVLWRQPEARSASYQLDIWSVTPETDLRYEELMAISILRNAGLRWTLPNDREAAWRIVEEAIIPATSAYAFLSAGEPRIAAAQFQQALESSDISDEVRGALHNDLGAIYLLLHRADLAEPEFRRSLECEANALAWTGIGSAHIARREWEAAPAAFQKAITLDPYHPAPYCGMGIVLAINRDIGSANDAYQQAISIAPTASVPHVLQAKLYELSADIGAAIRHYKTAAQQAGSDNVLYQASLARAEAIDRNPPTAVPTATAKPIPSATPIPTSAIHTVEQGDTLQAIADQYGVTVNAIVEINSLDDSSTIIGIGQQLLIPAKPDQ